MRTRNQQNFQNNFIGGQDINIPMKVINCKIRIDFAIQDSKNIRNASKNISYANYKKMINNLKYLNNNVQSLILYLLRKYEEIFDGTLGNCTDSEYKIELLEGISMLNHFVF